MRWATHESKRRRSPGICDLVRADGARQRAFQESIATSSRMP